MATQSQNRVAYPIKRTFRSSIRLNYNHLIMKEVMGHLLSPKVPIGEEPLQIADVGSGTGAWALEIAAKHQNISVDAIDISDEQFSPVYRLSNVRFRVHDCFQPFPQDMLGQYHVVYMRFWLCSVNNPDAGPLLNNIISLLRPGGYLEWVEPLPFLTTVYKPSPDLATPALDRHVQIFQKPYEHSSYQWVENLPNLFKEHGLEVLATDQHPVQDQYRAMWGQSNLAGLEDIVNESIVATESEGIRKHQAALEAEMKTGANLDNTFFSVVGRRPS